MMGDNVWSEGIDYLVTPDTGMWCAVVLILVNVRTEYTVEIWSWLWAVCVTQTKTLARYLQVYVLNSNRWRKSWDRFSYIDNLKADNTDDDSLHNKIEMDIVDCIKLYFPPI